MLAWLSVVFGVLATAALGIPILGYYLSPFLRRAEDEWVDIGAVVILLTYMFGGTPSNLAISVMEQTRAEVIAGLNLPMLIKLASVRGRTSLEDCVACAQEAGRKYITTASRILAREASYTSASSQDGGSSRSRGLPGRG